MRYNYRPLREEYLCVAKILQNDFYLKLDEEQFIAEVKRKSDGTLDDRRLKQLYYNLKREVR